MSKRPNILLFFTDQQRADTIAALGNEIIQTPCLDRLVSEGVAFERAFTPSPVCVPARCALYYGLYPHHTDCYDNNNSMLEGRPSMMSELTRAGYRTHGIGKMHFTPDFDALHGFQTRERQEEVSGTPMDDYVKYLADNGLPHIFDYHGQRSEMYYVPQLAQMATQHHPTNWVGTRSVNFIENHDFNTPLFLMTSFIHPHPPFAVPTPWNKLYRSADMPLPHIPENSGDMTTYFNKVQNNFKYKDAGSDFNLNCTSKAFYYACISFIDYQIGRVLTALEKTGQIDNTLIIFTSDHGELMGDYNCFGKRTMLDCAARIPMLVRFPDGKYAGRRVTEVSSLVDIMPTALNAATTDTVSDLDGMNLEELAKGASGRKYVFSQIQRGKTGLYMIASSDKKYIYSAADQKEYFLDRALDPLETVNFASGKRAHPDLDTMRRELIQTVSAEGDNTENGCWKSYPPAEFKASAGYQDNKAACANEAVIPEGYRVTLKIT